MKKHFITRVLLSVISILCLLCLAASAADMAIEVNPAACVVDIEDIIKGVKSTYIPDYTYFVAHSTQKWVGSDNIDGVITESCNNKEVENTHGRYGGAWQSNGFARFVFYHVFGEVPSYDYHCNKAYLSKNVTLVGRYASKCTEFAKGETSDGLPTEENLRKLFGKAKIGDIIVLAPKNTCFLNGTSMVFLDATNAGVQVYQADYTGACAVTEMMIPYSTLANYHCVSLLRAKNYPTEQYLEPVKVTQVTSKEKGYAHNENVDISWLPAKYAETYQVELVNQQGQIVCVRENVTGEMLTLTEVPAGTYTAKVIAINGKGRSEATESETFVVHPKLMVTFVDYDGSPISVQEVAYGKDVIAPTVPIRKGHKFAGWSEGLKNITKDMEIQALYELEKYNVTFYKVGKKDTIGQTQKVNYGESAIVPQDEAEFGLSDGYVFSGWHIEFGSDGTDYTCVDGDMVVIATQTWGEGKLPITINLNAAVLREDSKTYDITGTVKNTGTTSASFKLLATMKTSAGKAVKCVILDEYTLAAGASANVSDTIIYSEKISSIEYVAVGVKGNDKTGGAYSVLTSVGISAKKTWSTWSGWTTSYPSGHDVVESKTQYRYRNRQWATSSSSSLGSSWNYSYNTYTWSSWSGWSGWSSSYVGNSETVNTQSRTVYSWFYYDCPYCGGHSYYNRHYSWAGGCGNWISDSYYRTTWSTYRYNQGGDFHGTGRNYTDYSDAGRAYAWASGAYQTSQTQYRYQTRYKIYTYHFWRWYDWSSWSDTYYSGEETESRTVYRFRDEVDLSDPSAGVEDTSGSAYTMQGEIKLTDGTPDVLEGRRATIMVYKKTNSDPTEAQLEYVGQIKIGAGNSYDFTFRPKDDPSEKTGDFIVSLGIEGCDKLVNIATIEPEGVTHTVRFYADGEIVPLTVDLDGDGEFDQEQEVKHGSSAILPQVPEKEGYFFVKWSEATTAVESDMNIDAVYHPMEYTITFIDWENGTTSQAKVPYGAEIPYPELTCSEGMISRTWDKATTAPVATENMVVQTVTEYQKFTVVFKDEDVTYSTQTVEYGKAAKLPAAIPYAQDKTFERWVGDCDYTNITKDVVFTPSFVYAQTVAEPQADVTKQADGTSTVNLSCETEGATIYYVIEEHEDAAVMMEEEQIESIKNIRLDLLQVELMENLDVTWEVEPTPGIPATGFDFVAGATGQLEKDYDFTKGATVYNGEEIVLNENQTIIFMAKADGMNDSTPQLENMENAEIYYTGEVTKNTLRQYKQTVEGDLILKVDSDKPIYKEGQFSLCLYDERGVMVDLIALNAMVVPGSNEIRFENIVVPTSKVCTTGKLISWLSNGDVTPILDVQPFQVK